MDKPFFDVVDYLYHIVIDNIPQPLRQFLDERDMATAFVLGATGTYGIVRGLQWTSRNVMNRVIPQFDEKWLPVLEKISIAGMASAPILYVAIDPQSAREIMTQHPTYTSGMAGVYVGSIAGAVQDLVRRSKEKYVQETLEQRLEVK